MKKLIRQLNDVMMLAYYTDIPTFLKLKPIHAKLARDYYRVHGVFA